MAFLICDLCDTNYIGYTCRHLHQRVEEHKHSVIGKHFRDVHGLTPDNLIKNFKVIKKCRSKLECLFFLIHEGLFCCKGLCPFFSLILNTMLTIVYSC